MQSDSQPSHDLFISYAHVDDIPLPCEDKGWVTILVEALGNLLAQKMGRIEDFSIWWDESNLQGNHEITPEISQTVQRASTMLVVLSPGYLKSRWCRQEKDLFFEVLEDRPQGRVFVVEKQELNQEQTVPAELEDIKGYRLWYRDDHNRSRTLTISSPEPHKTEYFRVVEDLAYDLADKLKSLKARPQPPSKPRATVFLAEVTDDLEHRREQIRRYLDDEQIAVLPSQRHLEGQKFRDAIEEELPQCELFVQLLSRYPGRRPPAIPEGYLNLQLDRAREFQLPILQWRDPSLRVDRSIPRELQELLEGVTVYAETLERFKERVVQTATAPPESPSPSEPGRAPVVFINFERRDRALAEAIRNHIDQRLISMTPLSEGGSRQIRTDLENKLLSCDALILVYGEGTLSWVDMQILNYNKITSRREHELHALGIYDGPPEQKPEVSTRAPNLKILSCRRGLDKDRLRSFLAPLLKKVAS